MRTFAVLLFALLSAMVLLGVLRSEAIAGVWLSTFVLGGDAARGSSDLIVKIKKKNKGNKCKSEHSCPAGYVVLDKPNAYGACCEAKEGIPKPAPAEAEQCKFGMVGTPPNDCHCPEGTEFQGYKGCVAKKRTCIAIPKNAPIVKKCEGATFEELADGNVLYCCPQ